MLQKSINVVKVFLILSVFIFSSCKKNKIDPVIGVWNLVSVNGKEVNDCMQKSEVSISANGNYSVVNYAKETDGTCAVQNTANGVWKNKENNIYSVQIDGHSEREMKIIFSNKKNTMTSTSTSTTTTHTSVMKRKQ